MILMNLSIACKILKFADDEKSTVYRINSTINIENLRADLCFVGGPELLADIMPLRPHS